MNAPIPTLYVLPLIFYCTCLITGLSVHPSCNPSYFFGASLSILPPKYFSLQLNTLTAVEDLCSFFFGLKLYVQCNTNLHLLSLDTCLHLYNPALSENIEHSCDPPPPQVSSRSLAFSPHPTSPGAVTVLIFFHPQLVLSLLEFHINGIL